MSECVDDTAGDLSVSDVARATRCHPMTIYRAIRDGRIPAFRVGRSWRIRREDLAAIREGLGCGTATLETLLETIVARVDELTAAQRHRLVEAVSR